MADWRERGLLGLLAALGGAALLTGVVLASGPAHGRAPIAADEAGTELKFQGWVRAVDDKDGAWATLAVATANGTFDVLVDEGTKVLDSENGQPLDRDALAVAMPVDVQGTVTDAAQVRAKVISVGTIRPTLEAEELSLRGRLLALFEQVAKVRKGVALSMATRDGLCSICHVRMRPQVFQQVRQNDAVIQCDSCQRILYWVPPPAPTPPPVTIG